nr:MAG TPA: hypothetical protein [Caudoviricetes sp.]
MAVNKDLYIMKIKYMWEVNTWREHISKHYI